MSRAVVVTGAAAGIGHAVAGHFAAAGDRVLLVDIDGAAAGARAAALGPSHAALAADIADPVAAPAIMAACRERFGRIDVLVNNAGVIDSGGTPFTEQPLAALQRLLAINLLGMERLSLAARQAMREQEPGPDGLRGAIVNMASGAAFRAIPLRNGYSASKAGVVAMTRAHGCAWAGEGIRVNALAPGYIRTDLVAELIRRGRVDPALAERRIPLGRMGRPEEMAACVGFLAGAAGMAGAVLIADGGGQIFGGSDEAGQRRGAAPRPPPPGRPCYVVAGADTPLGRACMAHLSAGADVVAERAEEAAARFGRLDGLVNAAGSDRLDDPALDSAAQLARHLEPQFLAAQAAGRIMLAQGWGAVVNLTSIAGQAAGLGPAGGGVAAGAVGMLTRSMACEWGGSGVRANAVAAGLPAAGLLAAGLLADGRRLAGPPVAPCDVAAAAAFLLGPAASYVTGSVLPLDGGAGIWCGPDRER